MTRLEVVLLTYASVAFVGAVLIHPSDPTRAAVLAVGAAAATIWAALIRADRVRKR